MQPVNSFLDRCKKTVKGLVRPLAHGLNTASGGRLSPNAITLLGLAMHIPIAWFIAQGSLGWAGLLLIIFGLFDTLDGELARLQKSESKVGMLLDSTTDRMKEVILYMGIAYFLIDQAHRFPWQPATLAVFAAAACGGSVLVSYVNAWGDALLTAKGHSHAVNQTFRSGVLRFEVRMALLVMGLLTGWLAHSVIIIAVLAWLTAFERLRNVIVRLQ